MVTIVQFCCLESYCKSWTDEVVHSSTGKLNEDSVKIGISEIRKVNSCLIKLKYQNNIIVVKDSIINLKDVQIKLYEEQSNKLKTTVVATERLNKHLNKSLDKYKRRNKIYGGVAGGLATSLFLFLLIK